MCYNRIVLGGSDYMRSTLARFSCLLRIFSFLNGHFIVLTVKSLLIKGK